MANTLTIRQRDLLEEVFDLHQTRAYGGLDGRGLTGKDREAADALIVAGLAQWHPPGYEGALLITTPLGRERVIDIRKRRDARKRARDRK